MDDQQLVIEQTSGRVSSSSSSKSKAGPANIYPVGTAVMASDFQTLFDATDENILQHIDSTRDESDKFGACLAYDHLNAGSHASVCFLVVAGDAPARWVVMDREKFDKTGFRKEDVMATLPDDDQKINHDVMPMGKGKNKNWLFHLTTNPTEKLHPSVYGK